jgi:hypothetical protein
MWRSTEAPIGETGDCSGGRHIAGLAREDREHKPVLAVVPGARVTESVEEVVAEVEDRLDDQPPALSTSDEYAPDETVLATTFSVVVPREPTGPGCRPLLPQRRPDPCLTYATVYKERENDRAVSVHRKVVLGSQQAADPALKASVCRRTSNTAVRGASARDGPEPGRAEGAADVSVQ